MAELPVIPTAIAGRPLGDIELLRVSLTVFHPVATDWTGHEVEFEFWKLSVLELGDTMVAVDILPWIYLFDTISTSRADECGRRPLCPSNTTIDGRRMCLRDRESETGGVRVLSQWLGELGCYTLRQTEHKAYLFYH